MIKDFTKILTRTTHDTGLEPQNLMFEITESIMMSNTEKVFETLTDIKNMGVRLAIDAFGTGYSSLSYLTRLPIYTIKIDLSFIKEIGLNSDAEAFVKAIISMAHSMRLKVIAEGVETVQQLAFLHEHHCDEMQGYLFSKPMASVEATTFIANEIKRLDFAFSGNSRHRGIFSKRDRRCVVNS
jgi:EAL domain-containing protein (putative c-di-GMP-specific phosphodiesterase class I)